MEGERTAQGGIRPGALSDFYGKFLDGFEAANPEWFTNSVLMLIYDGLYSLFHYIEDPETEGVSWDLPETRLTIRYPAEGIAEGFPVGLFSPEGQTSPDQAAKAVFDGLTAQRTAFIHVRLTQGVYYVKDKGGYILHLPQDIADRLQRLPEDRREKRAEKIRHGYPFALPFATRAEPLEVTDGETGKARKAWGAVTYRILPPVFDPGLKEISLDTEIGLEVKGLRISRWREEDRQGFKRDLLALYQGRIKQDQFDFIEDMEPIPWAIGEEEPARVLVVKASSHLQRQYVGPTVKPGQPNQLSLLENADIKEQAEEQEISIIGIEPTKSRERAIFAIQKMLNDTAYRGNLPGETFDGTGPIKFKGYRPTLRFSPTEYLEAYGVSKVRTSRGKMEYSGKERREALQALKDLALQRFILVYKRRYWRGGKEVVDRIETIAQLVEITQGWEALTRAEDAALDAGEATGATDKKLSMIEAKPHPVFVDQLDSNFILKPANYLQEIKVMYPNASKFVYSFIEYLWAEGGNRRGKNTGWIIEINYRLLAEKLRMDSRIKNRKWKEIRQTLNECYRVAENRGYILGHETIPGSTVTEKEVIRLNPARFTNKAIEAAKPGGLGGG